MRASQLSSGANRTSAPASHAIASTSMPFAESMPSSCKSFSAAVIDLNADCPDRRSRPSRGDPAVYRQSRVRTHLHPCVPPSSCAPGGGRRLPQPAQESPACERSAGGTRDRKGVVEEKSVSIRVELGGRRIIKKKKNKSRHTY